MIATICNMGLEALVVCLVVGISLTTMGKVWPVATIIRERFTALDAELVAVTEISVELVDVELEAIQVELEEVGDLTVEVEVVDTVTGQVAEESVLTVNMECE